jgi:hypothetical protein
MLTVLTRQFWTFFGALIVALVLQWALLPATARADDQADRRAAVETASARYEAALKALESGARDQSAAEVRRFRESWQALIMKYNAQPQPAADGEDQAGMFMQVDAQIVGAMLVIDMGNRDAARKALAPIGDTLAELTKKTAPQKK